MASRHLRLMFLDANGDEISPDPLLTGVLPAFRLPVTGLEARSYVGVGHEPRREAAIRILIEEIRKKHPAYSAVALIACPPRAILESKVVRRLRFDGRVTPTTAYTGSFAVMSQKQEVVVGDYMTSTLEEMYAGVQGAVKTVLDPGAAEREAASQAPFAS